MNRGKCKKKGGEMLRLMGRGKRVGKGKRGQGEGLQVLTNVFSPGAPFVSQAQVKSRVAGVLELVSVAHRSLAIVHTWVKRGR